MNTGSKINVEESEVNFDFIQNFLDTIPGNVIVLDQNGKIVCHDNDWHEFAKKFGFSKITNFKDSNYFNIAPSIKYLSKGKEKDLFVEIKNLFIGKTEQFEGDYTTKIGNKNYLISLVGKKFNYAGNNWVSITYLDVTRQKNSPVADLGASEDLLGTFNQVSVGMAMVSLNGRFLDVNKTFHEIMGYSHTEMLELSYRDITYSEDTNLYSNEIQQLTKGEKDTFSGEKRYCRKSGEIIRGKITISLIRKKSGQPKCLHAVFEDISDRLKIQSALNESRVNYKNLVEQAQDGIALIQNDRVKFINSALVEMGGYSLEELRGKPFVSFIADDELPKVVEIHKKRLNNEKNPNIYETAIKKKNGDILEVEFNSRLTENDGTQLVMIRDISERKKEAKNQKFLLDELQQERNIFVSGPVVVFKWANLDGYPTEYVSPNVVEVFGYTQEELTSGKVSYEELISELDVERVNNEDVIQKNIKKNKHYTQEPYRIIRKDGEIIWVLDHTTINRDEKGTILNYLGYVVDISKQKKMEDALRKSEVKYRTLLENIPQKIFLKDKNSVYISCNQNYADDLSIKASEIKGKTDDELFPEKFSKKFQFDDKRIMKNGKSEELIEEYLHFGQVVLNRVIKTPVKNSEGEITGVLGIFWDITEQHKTEELLRESEEKFRVLITNIEEVIYILDKEGKVILSEGKGLSKLGLKAGETVGFSAFELYKDFPDVLNYIRKSLKGETMIFESFVHGYHYKNWCTPQKNNRGEISGIIGLSMDISDQKKTENELIKSKERFHEVVMNLQEGFYSTTLQGEIIFYNKEYIDILELDPDKDYTGQILHDFWQNHKERDKYIKEILNKGYVKNYLVYARTAKGNRVILRTNSKLINDKEENSTRIEGVFQDVTIQTEAKEKLRISEERLSSFIESATDGFALFDSDLNLVMINSMILKIFPPHIAKNVRIGANILEILPFIKKTDRYKKYLEVVKTGIPLLLKDIVSNEEISDRSLDIRAFKVNDGLGMIFTDTTDSKRARLALKESEEKYRRLIEQAKDGIGLIQDDRIVFTNSVLTEMLGYTKDEFKNLSFVDIAHPDELSRLIDFHKKRMSGKKLPSIYETRLLKKNGDILEVEFNVARTSFLKEVAVLIMARDISERKKTEKEIVKYQERLKALASELIVTEEKQRKQIATDLHDNVGQLLASSRLQMAAINEGMEMEVIMMKIKSISFGLLQAIQSIRNTIFNLSPPQLNEIGLFAATADWLEDQIELKHDIKTIINGEDRFFPLAENTRFLIFRSIRELLINIVKHAKANNIIVTISEVDQNMHIRIADDGIGFDYKPESFRHKRKSLGLFSINERVTDIGGSMKIDTKPGKGTIVELIVPIKY